MNLDRGSFMTYTTHGRVMQPPPLAGQHLHNDKWCRDPDCLGMARENANEEQIKV